MRYLLNNQYSLCGYWGVPYALFDACHVRTRFLSRERFMLLYRCDGAHDLEPDALSEEEAAALDEFLEQEVIRPCGIAPETNGGSASPARSPEPNGGSVSPACSPEPNGGSVSPACSPEPDGAGAADAHLLPHQEYRNFGVKYREDVQLSLTGLCNYRCRHCFQSAPHGKLGTTTFAQLMDVADQMAACGIRRVGFTGGEPLYRDDFWEVFDGFTQRGVLVESVFTNGSLLDEEWMAQLDRRVQAGVGRPSISVSFDGVGWHDWLRGVDGAEEVALRAMRLCLDHGYNVSVSMCLHRHNAATLRDTVNLLAGMGVSSLKVNITRPEGEWVNEPENCLTTQEGWEAYLDYLPHYFEDGAPMALMLEGCFDCQGHTQEWTAVHDKRSDPGWEDHLACGVLRRHLYVSPQGAVVPCMSMGGTPIEADFPNLRETPLHDILQPGTDFITKTEITARQVGDANDECRDCEHLPVCWGGCRACGALFGGFFEAYDRYACEWHKGNWRPRFEQAVARGLALQQSATGD